MRVLHFLPVYAPAWRFGGPVLSVSRLCEGLAAEGVDVRVITTNAGLPELPVEQLCIPQNVNGVEVIYYPVDQQVGTIRSRELVSHLSDHMNWAELLHLSSIWQPLGLPVQKSAHSTGVPVIQTLRGALGPYSWRRGWWKKIPYFLLSEMPLLQRASRIHCTSLQEAKELSRLRLKPPVDILPNPIDLSKYSCDPSCGENWRIKMGIPSNQPLLLVAGRQHHKKGLDMLPRVLKSVSHKPWRLLFVGPDDDGTGRQVRKQLIQLGLADRCYWLDSQPAHQLAGPYNAADWLLLPSRHENFGNVVIEALACGAGVIATPSVGVVNELQDCDGLFIEPRNSVKWSLALLRALSRHRPGHRAEQLVKARYSARSLAKKLISTYDCILSLP